MKGELSRARQKRNEKRNREAITGKEALYQTYVDMGLDCTDAARDLMQHIQRQKVYLKARTGSKEC
jgi:hypothetical protein